MALLIPMAWLALFRTAVPREYTLPSQLAEPLLAWFTDYERKLTTSFLLHLRTLLST